MRSTLSLALTLYLLPMVAVAQDAQAKIIGPTGGKPGDILVLDATNSVADHYAWSVEPELPNERPTIMVLEDGRKCLVASVPGTYTIFLAVSTAGGIDQIKWTVTFPL